MYVRQAIELRVLLLLLLYAVFCIFSYMGSTYTKRRINLLAIDYDLLHHIQVFFRAICCLWCLVCDK